MKTLCDLTGIRQSGSREFRIEHDGHVQEIFIVLHNNRVYGYKNICPHQGLSLNWMPDQFLNQDQTLIQCSNHDALFRIEDGYCIAGPCLGESLTPVPLQIIDGWVALT